MKQFLSLFFFVITVSVYAQSEWTHETIKSETRNINLIEKYTASDGSTWEVGQTVTFGVTSGNGVFTYVYLGDGVMTAVTPAMAGWGGKTAEIKKIQYIGNNKNGRNIWVICKGPGQPFRIDLEMALKTGEVATDGYTSEKALDELKRAKDKLDLGLITQEEFDKLKAELAKYID